MGGINSLSGLNQVNVDFRPTVTTNVQKTGIGEQGTGVVVRKIM